MQWWCVGNGGGGNEGCGSVRFRYQMGPRPLESSQLFFDIFKDYGMTPCTDSIRQGWYQDRVI
ncbi:hypothetical protein DERF_004740 [Dermatophagoides farinae]|uniref:Uncharacterized protein n=1 Tax=Dermatophagoides farinae TaxID=6954 RepID=A0A922I5L3_DERFA|nr:hypothetical protein DERF_004740 [Dermatophagoides farinae]